MSSATRCAFERPCHSLICDLSSRFGVSTVLAIAPFVIGEDRLPVPNHCSIDDLSYECPSAAITGSRMISWDIGHRKMAGLGPELLAAEPTEADMAGRPRRGLLDSGAGALDWCAHLPIAELPGSHLRFRI